MASGTGSLVDRGVAWDGGGEGDDLAGVLLELFNGINHDGGVGWR